MQDHAGQSLSDEEKLDWLQLIRTQNIGPITFYNLMSRCKSAKEALRFAENRAKKNGKEIKIPSRDEIIQEYEAVKKFGASMIARCEPDYPEQLAVIEDAPPLITVMGDTKLLHKKGIGIVGSRNASHSGVKMAALLAKGLGESGLTVISGLARGIDAAAHKASLETGTVAVIAGGIDVIFPTENTDLHHEIAKHGVIVAESPFGSQPRARDFPRRNRIISGLSAGVVVVEAAPKSGSLITARCAVEQNRDVFAVPGNPADPRAQGTNKLIADYAYLVQSADDIIEKMDALPYRQPPAKAEQDLFAFEEEEDAFIDETPMAEDTVSDEPREKILEFIGTTPIEVDEVIYASGLETRRIQTLLLELELEGLIIRQPGNKVSKA